jgi:hypothetical protein
MQTLKISACIGRKEEVMLTTEQRPETDKKLRDGCKPKMVISKKGSLR